MNMQRKRWHEKKGRMAERLCSTLLRLKGYKILKRRYKTKVGEIDIIAQRGKMLIFVEVKTRLTLLSALESISLNQRRRIEKAAQFFLQFYQNYSGYDLRFDVMLVAPWRIKHLKDAWIL